MPVVAAIDDSDRANAVLREANKLAELLDTSIHAVHVIERSRLVEILEKDVEGQNLAENAEVQAIAEDIVANADDITAETTPLVRIGNPAEEITAVADEEKARYVVIGGRQRSPTGKALFGSVTQKVMFQADVPVVNVALDK